MNTNANRSIECTVQQCAHHCQGENYCSLNKILVGTHEAHPTVDQCPDCKSFRKKSTRKRRRFAAAFSLTGVSKQGMIVEKLELCSVCLHRLF